AGQDLIVHIEVGLNYLPFVFIEPSTVIIQQSPVRLDVADIGWVIWIIIGVRALGRSISKKRKSWLPVVIASGYTRVVSFFYSTVDLNAHGQLVRDVSVDIGLDVGSTKFEFITEYRFLVKSRCGDIVVCLFRTT